MKQMIKVITNPALQNIATIQHGFFTRHGGISKGYYSSLNCAYACADDPKNVAENRCRVTQYFGYPLGSLVTTKNVHGNNVATIDKSSGQFLNYEADAMVTKQEKIMLGSDSADCPIVLFADSKASIIGLAHAGWRGAKSGIIEATIAKMVSLGATTCDITAAISPCINQPSYEVDYVFYQQFISDNSINKKYFISSNKLNRFLFDLPSYVADRLFKLNLKTVSLDTAIDTYTNENDFFSCRRSTHKSEEDFGGHFSCIVINK